MGDSNSDELVATANTAISVMDSFLALDSDSFVDCAHPKEGTEMPGDIEDSLQNFIEETMAERRVSAEELEKLEEMLRCTSQKLQGQRVELETKKQILYELRRQKLADNEKVSHLRISCVDVANQIQLQQSKMKENFRIIQYLLGSKDVSNTLLDQKHQLEQIRSRLADICRSLEKKKHDTNKKRSELSKRVAVATKSRTTNENAIRDIHVQTLALKKANEESRKKLENCARGHCSSVRFQTRAANAKQEVLRLKKRQKKLKSDCDMLEHSLKKTRSNSNI